MSALNLDKERPSSDEERSVRKSADTIFILSLVSLLFCCWGGIVASIYGYRAKQSADVGDLDEARRNMGIAKGWMIASFIIGILLFLGRLVTRR